MANSLQVQWDSLLLGRPSSFSSQASPQTFRISSRRGWKSKQIYKLYNIYTYQIYTFIEGSCEGLIPRIHPRILPRICPRGIVPVRPHVTSFITAQTTFKTSRDILSRPFALLSSPYLPDSLKSSLICETLVSWHRIDWWDSSHPHVYFSRQTRQVLGHQQDWKDDKLCHGTPSDTTPNRPAEVMIVLSLMRNHHHKGQLSTIESFSKSDLGFGGCVQTSLCKKAENPDSGIGAGTFIATSKGGIHPQLTRYQHWCRLWERNTNDNTFQKSIVGHG